jgi:hypothetical protein
MEICTGLAELKRGRGQGGDRLEGGQRGGDPELPSG